MDADEETPHLLEWLTETEFVSKQRYLSEQRAEGTCEWLLSNREFISWRQNEDGIILYSGDLGTGKSVLASFVVDELVQHRQHPTSSGIVHIFFDHRQQDDQRVKNLFAVMLRQLIQTLPSYPLAIKDLYRRYQNRRSEIPMEYLSETLHTIANLFRKVFVVVDALDECSVPSEFIEALLDFQRACKANIFVTTRPSASINNQFHGTYTLLTSSHSTQDLAILLESQMARLPRFIQSNDELKARIKIDVLKAANGNFLLCKLYVDYLRRCVSIEDIRDTLERLSTDSPALHKLYDEAIDRIKYADTALAGLAMKALRWIVYAKRPLVPIELRHALAVRDNGSEFDLERIPQIEDIISACNGMVVVRPESGTLVLVHQSLKNYLARSRERHFPVAENTMALECIGYLCSSQFGSGFCETDEEYEQRLRDNPLFDYASKYWGFHAQHFYGLTEKFFRLEGNLEACAQAMLTVAPGTELIYSQKPPRRMTGLHLAAYFGLSETKYLADNGNPNPKDSHGRTPLTYASENGHEEVFEELLQRNTEDLKQSTGWYALKFAALKGYENIVGRLLYKGVEPEYPADFDNKSPIWYAAQNGHEAVVKQLIAVGADIHSERDGYTPLAIAIINRHGQVVKTLQDNGANIESITEVTMSLGFAVSSGNVAMTALLLTRGVDVDSKSNEYEKSPLLLAVENGDEAIVRLLLSGDAKLEPNDDNGLTPLMVAVDGSHLEIIEVLLEHDATSSETQLHNKGDALLKAANMKQWSIVQSLLDHGSHRGIEDRIFGAVLVPAVLHGREEIILTWLRQPESSDYMADEANRSLLSYAAEKGMVDIFKLLSHASGANPVLADANGRTPISWAAACGHNDIVDMLSIHEGSIESKDHQGLTPLAWAAMGGHEKVTTLLLEKPGIFADQRDRNYRTPLSHAAEKGHKVVVQSLLRREDVYISSTDRKGRNSLSWAAGGGQPEIVELLLVRDASFIDSQDKENRTALSWAAASGKSEVVKLLFEWEANPTAVCKKQWNPLHYAAHSGHDSTAKFIVTKMYDSGLTYAVAPNGTTALTLAVQGNHLTLAKYLIKYDHISLNAQITSNNHAMLQKLIDLGCEIGAQGLDGFSPLVSAIRHHQNLEPCREIVDCLLWNAARADGIQTVEWRTVCKANDDQITILTEKEPGRMSISCERRNAFDIIRRVRNDFKKRLFMFEERLNLSPLLAISSNTGLEDNKLLRFVGKEKSGRVDFSIGIAFPCKIEYIPHHAFRRIGSHTFEMPPTRRFLMAWTMKRFLTADEGEQWEVTDFASSLPDGWIPEDSTQFFMQFITHLKSEWLTVCRKAEFHLSEVRKDIITAEKRSQNVMNGLLNDATLWIQLRSLLQDHVTGLEGFNNDCRDLRSLDGIIRRFSDEIEDALSKLDKASESLIEIEFNLTSIAEALKSTSLSVSMKRLTWITFVFLPLTFVAGLFGMNVDILKDNPAWWIYLPFAFGTMLLTITVWLFFKRNTGMEGKIEKHMAWLLKPQRGGL